MSKIRVIDNIHYAALDFLKENGHELGPDIENPDGILIRSTVLEVPTFGKSLKVVGRAGVGVNNILMATENGVCVFNAAGANAPDVADQVLHILLDYSRRIPKARKYSQDTGFGIDQDKFRDLFEKGKASYRGYRLQGRTLAVIGAGNVGMQVIERARSPWLDMQVVAFDIAWLPKNRRRALELGVKIADNFEDAVANADFATFHVPEDASTKNYIRAQTLALMKKGVVVLNFSREGICNVEDMLLALATDHVAHHYTDLPHVLFRSHPRVTMTPHIGGETEEAQVATSMFAAERIHRFLTRNVTEGSVNFPPIDEQPLNGAKTLLCIPHRNVPGVIAGVSTHLSDAGLNIEDETTRHKGALSVSIMSLNNVIPNSVVEELQHLPNVLRVNVCLL